MHLKKMGMLGLTGHFLVFIRLLGVILFRCRQSSNLNQLALIFWGVILL